MRIAPALIASLIAFPSMALSPSIPPVPRGQENCIDGMRKNVNISISFNGQEKSLAEARAAIDNSRKGLEQAAAKAGVEIQPNNYNYNVSLNTNYNNGQQNVNYNYNGSMSYRLDNEEVAKKLTEKLDEQKRQFSMNVSANKCNQ